jgi:hypothetical protein
MHTSFANPAYITEAIESFTMPSLGKSCAARESLAVVVVLVSISLVVVLTTRCGLLQ